MLCLFLQAKTNLSVAGDLWTRRLFIHFFVKVMQGHRRGPMMQSCSLCSSKRNGICTQVRSTPSLAASATMASTRRLSFIMVGEKRGASLPTDQLSPEPTKSAAPRNPSFTWLIMVQIRVKVKSDGTAPDYSVSTSQNTELPVKNKSQTGRECLPTKSTPGSFSGIGCLFLLSWDLSIGLSAVRKDKLMV